MPRPVAGVERWIGPALLTGAIVVAAVLSLYRLDVLSLWLDEATSLFVARLDWFRPWEAIRVEGSVYMSLYFVLMSPWVALGNSEAWLRGLSVVFAVVSIPALYVLGRDLFDRRVGILAAGILAFHAFVVQYAQEARSYTLLLLLTVVATTLFVRAVARPTWTRWLAYAAVAGIALYAHIFAGFVVAAHVAGLLAARRGRRGLPRAAIAFAVIAVIWSPLLAIVLGDSARGLSWIGEPSIDSLAATWSRLAGQGPALAWLYLILVMGTAVRLAAGWWTGVPEWGLAVVLLGIAVPVLGSFALSTIKPMFVDRYLIEVVPFLVLAAAAGLARVGQTGLRILAVAILVGLHLSGTLGYYGNYAKEDWRGAATILEEQGMPSDGVVFYSPYMRQPFEYYVERLADDRSLPSPLYPSPPWGQYGPGRGVGMPLDQVLGEDAAPPDRVWLILAHAFDSPERAAILGWIEDRYHQVQAEALPVGLEVRLYELHRGPDAPILVREPEAQSVEVGQRAVLSVVARGDPPLSYEWQRDGSTIPGETEAELRTPPATLEDDGARYRVVVANGAGQVESRELEVRVGAPAATYRADAPRVWSPLESRTYAISVRNVGVGSWEAGGENPVRLGVHFGTTSTVPGDGWKTDQRYSLPRDVPPGGTVELHITVTSPRTGGSFVLHHRMVREGVTWFHDAHRTSVDVAGLPIPPGAAIVGIFLVGALAAVGWIFMRRRRSS